MTIWPDDAQVAVREWRIRHAVESGHAICPSCLTVHGNAGREHRRRPWSITPRCIVDGCGDVLTMPQPPPTIIAA